MFPVVFQRTAGISPGISFVATVAWRMSGGNVELGHSSHLKQGQIRRGEDYM